MYLLKLCKFSETFVICNIHFGLCSVSCSVIFRMNIITKLTITKMAKAQWPNKMSPTLKSATDLWADGRQRVIVQLYVNYGICPVAFCS